MDGTVFHKTGNITGGQGEQDSAHAKRWEEKEVDDLRRKKEDYTAKLIEISKEKRKVYQDDHIQSEIQSAESRLGHLNEEFATITQKIESCNTEMQHLKDQNKKANFEIEDVIY